MNQTRIAIFAEQGHFTPVHNLVFRVVMPQLSSSAWKVLCYLISETVGYNRRSETISYSAIMTGTGLKSSATVAKALAELLAGEPFGCPLIVRQMGTKCGVASHESARYGLNLKFTVALQKVKPLKASKTEARDGLENEALPIRNGRELIEESNERFSHSRRRREAGDGIRESGDGGPSALPPLSTESSHFLAVCEVCELDPEMISPRKLNNAASRAAQLARRYSPEQIRLAGSRWPLATAPHPDQLLDSIQALLNRKEKHEHSPTRPQGDGRAAPGPLNEHQRNAAQRRELMAELSRRFR